MFTETNTGTNLPAQIDIFATDGDEYHFLVSAGLSHVLDVAFWSSGALQLT